MVQPEHTPTRHSPRKKLLLTEFWGLGDLTLATTILPAALEHYEVTIAAKPPAQALLQPSYPDLQFLAFDPPWTAFRGKYHLWRWPWIRLAKVIRQLRAQRFDVAVSVRTDPRDHLLMYAACARERVGFPTHGSAAFLTKPVDRRPHQHKVEDWRALGRALGLSGMNDAAPSLKPAAYAASGGQQRPVATGKPLVVLHPGARIPVRRWPEEYFLEIISRLRSLFSFHLALVVEPDGYGRKLEREAQSVITSLKIEELVHLMGMADLVVCNDSGPGHIAAACGTPVCVVFGPGDPEAFRPWGTEHFVAVRDLCKFRPCFDYCRFPEPYCLTRLTPDVIWDDLRSYVEQLLLAPAQGTVSLRT